nr:immunoglobulin light chain junction region [Macaca mulatta]
TSTVGQTTALGTSFVLV